MSQDSEIRIIYQGAAYIHQSSEEGITKLIGDADLQLYYVFPESCYGEIPAVPILASEFLKIIPQLK